MKNKISTILKISVISLIIILSTIGIANAAFYPAVSNPGATSLTRGKIGYDELAADDRILCCEEGVELSNQKKQYSNFHGEAPVVNYQPFSNYDFTGEPIDGNALSAYILAHTTGSGGSEYGRRTQWAWWAMVANGWTAKMGNGWAINAGVLDDLNDIESIAWGNGEIINISIISDINYKTTYEIVKEKLKSDPIINEAIEKSENQNLLDAIIYIAKLNTIDGNTKREEIKKIFNEIYLDTEAFDVNTAINSILDANGEYKTDGAYAEGTDLYKEAVAFQEYVDKFLKDNKTLKDNVQPAIYTEKDDKNPLNNLKEDMQVGFNTKTNCFVIGPIQMNYPDASYNDIKFAGIEDIHLNAIVSDENRLLNNTTNYIIEMARNIGIPESSIDSKFIISSLQPSEYAFINEFNEVYREYPPSGKPFYITVKYDENLTQFTNFDFDYKYMTYDGGDFIWYKAGKYDKYEWDTKYKVEEYCTSGTCHVDEDNHWHDYSTSLSGTYYKTITTTDGKEPTAPSVEDVLKRNKYSTQTCSRGSVLYEYSYVGPTVVSIESRVVYTGDGQDLAASGKASLDYIKGNKAIEFIQDRNPLVITKKIIENETEKDISKKIDRVFDFDIYVECKEGINHFNTHEHKIFDGKTYYKWQHTTLNSGSTIQESLPPYYVSNWGGTKGPEVIVEETDGIGTTYEEFKILDKEEYKNKYADSIWLDNYAPKNKKGYWKASENDSVEAENIKYGKHGHLSVIKKTKESQEKNTFNIKVQLTNYDNSENGETIEFIVPLTIDTNRKDSISFIVDEEIGQKLGLEKKDNKYVFGEITTGKIEETGTIYARWDSGKITWYGDKAVEYSIYEVDEDYKDQSESTSGFFDNYIVEYNASNGSIKECTDCNNKTDSHTISSVTNMPNDDTYIEVELKKLLKLTDEEDEPIILAEDEEEEIIKKEYNIDVAFDRERNGERITLKKDTKTIKATVISNYDGSGENEIIYEPEFAHLDIYDFEEGDIYYVVITEHETNDSSFFDGFSATLNGEDDGGEWNEVRKDDGSIDYVERVITNVVKGNKYNFDTTVENVQRKRYIEFSIVKKFESPSETPTSDVYYFKVEKTTIDNQNELTRAEHYFFGDDVKPTESNGEIVEVRKDDGYIRNSLRKLYEDNILIKVTEVDENGYTYTEYKDGKVSGDSIWEDCKPTSKNPDGFVWKKLDSNEVAEVEVYNQRDISKKIRLTKKILDENGEDKTDWYFENFPDSEFRFIVMAYKANNITREYFGVNEIVINKNNYEYGVISKDIDPTALGDEYTVVELFDSDEEKELYDTPGVWVVHLSDSEDNVLEVEAENKIGKTITIDKVFKNSDDFLPEEKFNFRVFEDKVSEENDRTQDFFGTDRIVIDKAAHDNGGVTSNYIYGNAHTIIVEYDDNDMTYKAYKALSESDKAKYDGLWKKFVPTNDGEWHYNTIPSFVKAENYKIASIKIKKEAVDSNIPEEELNKEFTFNLTIKANNGTVSVGDKKNLSQYVEENIKLKIGEECSIDNIIWTGDAPIYEVTEVNLPDKWILDGYRTNEEWTPNHSLAEELRPGLNENEVVVLNTYNGDIPKDAKIVVTKQILDQNGVQTQLSQDTTFYFDIYLAGEGISYDGYTNEDFYIPKSLDELDENSKPITQLAVDVVAGSSQTVSTKTISYKSDKLEYKVVEVDENGLSYSEYKELKKDGKQPEKSLWEYFKPGISSSGKEGNKDGVWTGTLTKANPTSSVAKINAYNIIRIVKIDFNKMVIDQFGKLSPIVDGEKFYFNFTTKSSLTGESSTEKIVIRDDGLPVSKTYVLKNDEVLNYIFEEVDRENRTYTEYINDTDPNKEPSETWDYFTPQDKVGRKEGVIDGSSVYIKLDGANYENVLHDKLVITKYKEQFEIDEKFYFRVNDLSEEQLKALFPMDSEYNNTTNENYTTIDGKGYLVLTYGARSVVSKDITWVKGTNNPKYVVTETDEHGHTYEEGKDCDYWISYTPKDEGNDGITEVTLTGNTNKENKVYTCVEQPNEGGDIPKPFTFKKLIIENGKVTDTIPNNTEFRFKVNNGEKDLDKVGLEDLFPDYKAKIETFSDYTGKEIAVIKIDNSIYSTGLKSKNIKSSEKYKIIEVDEHGHTYSAKTDDCKFWKEYKPGNDTGIWEAGSNQTEVIGTNYHGGGPGDNHTDLNILKIKTEEWTTEVYKVKVEIATYDSQNGGYGEYKQLGEIAELTRDNPSKFYSHEEYPELNWKDGEEAPMVRFIEIEKPENTIVKYMIGEQEVSEGTPCILQDEITITLTVQNGGGGNNPKYETGNISIYKEVKGSQTNKKFEFCYAYSRDGENWGETQEITVPANQSRTTEDAPEWKKGEKASFFKIWESDTNGYALEDFEIENPGDVKDLSEYTENGHKIIKGRLNANTTDSKAPIVKIKATNVSTDVEKGRLKLLKTFEIAEQKEGENLDIKGILNDLAKKVDPEKYVFTFKVEIFNKNNEGYFIYNGTKYENNSRLEVEYTKTLKEFIDAYNNPATNVEENGYVPIGDIIEVEWAKGANPPSYKVTELSNNGKFWVGEIASDGGSVFKVNDIVVIKMTNKYTVKRKISVLTQLGGTVWEDAENLDKDGKTDGIEGNGIYEKDKDILMENVYVIPVRQIINRSTGKVVDYFYNSSESGEHKYQFIKEYDNFYYYITEGNSVPESFINDEKDIDINWGFVNVLVPGFASNEGNYNPEEYEVKYDVEFYYDGVTYEPTKFLEHATSECGKHTASQDNIEAKASTYMNNSSDEKFYVDSCAIENEADRMSYNEKFATVQGYTPMNSDFETTGLITGVHGEEHFIDYESNTQPSGDIQRAITTGLVRMNRTEDLTTLQNDMMRATTGQTGLKYFFGDYYSINNDFDLCEEESRTVEADAVYYWQKYLRIYPSANHINLGLVRREKSEILLDKKIESATIIINDKTKTYPINNDKEIRDSISAIIKDLTKDVHFLDNLSKIFNTNKFINNDSRIDEFNIYTSDYNYRQSLYAGTEVYSAYETFYKAIAGATSENARTAKELQVYLNYKISIKNASGNYDVVVNGIDDYSSNDLTYIDTLKGYNYIEGSEIPGSGLYAYIEQDEKEEISLVNVFEPQYSGFDFTKNYYEDKDLLVGDKHSDSIKVTSSANKMEINKSLELSAGETKYLYLTYKVDKFERFEEENFKLGIKDNTAEVNSYTTYYKGSKNYAGTIDRYSAPGNYNIVDKPLVMDQDTDFAKVDIIANDYTIGERKISGTAWLDSESNSVDGQILGDSKIGDSGDKKLAGITTNLVESIALPVKGENGHYEYTGKDEGSEYTEFEFYLNKTATDTDGKYTIDSYVDNGIVKEGIMPGNYIIRFFYGDQQTTNDAEYIINGQDYKTTAYEIEESSKLDSYIDNEWMNLFDRTKKQNEARDNEARRLKLIQDTQILNNENTAVFDISKYKSATEYAKAMCGNENNEQYIQRYNDYKSKLYVPLTYENGSKIYNGIINENGYAMFADTAKMNMKVEQKDDAEKPVGYEVTDVNCGIEERSRTKMYLDKQIEEVTLTTSSNKTFFHAIYDIDYIVENIENITKYGNHDNKPSNAKDGYEYNLVDCDESDGIALWVGLKTKGEVIGLSNLQALNDNMIFKNSNKVITQGFRYVNIDSTVLQGLKLEIKYRFTAINLSETDKYGEGLHEIVYENDSDDKFKPLDQRASAFETAIKELSSPIYKLGNADDKIGSLFFKNRTDEYVKTKKYGEYLGHTYYKGFKNQNSTWDADWTVTTMTHQIVDYVDNDIEFDELSNTTWSVDENLAEEFRNRVDAFVFVNEKVQNPTEVEYKKLYTSIDSDITNKEFVKELSPINDSKVITSKENDEEYVKLTDDGEKGIATTSVVTSKVFTSTDKGNTGMDNFAEILIIENTVGRRDMSTVHGNYDPRGGATTTTERDESATEIVTLSPPTGNEENERTMLNVIIVIAIVAIGAGTGVGLKLRLTKKSKDKTETK